MTAAPVIWVLGLSASGKSTMAAHAVAFLTALDDRGRVRGWQLLDGDQLRSFLGEDLGYSLGDRRKSVKMVALAAHLLSQNGVGVVVANISPFQDIREHIRKSLPGYAEVYCRCSLEACAGRDPKGHYRRFREGALKDVVGLDIPFQEPANPELILDTERSDVAANVGELERFLEKLIHV